LLLNRKLRILEAFFREGLLVNAQLQFSHMKIKLTILSISIFLTSAAFSQEVPADTIYYTADGKKTKASEAKYFRVAKKEKEKYVVKDYYMNGTLQMTGTYRTLEPPVKDGVFEYYNENGKKTSKAEFKNDTLENDQVMYHPNERPYHISRYVKGKKNGQSRTFYDDGHMKREEYFKDDVFESGLCYTKQGDDTTFYPFEEMPKFPGGEDSLLFFIKKNLNYPKKARENALQGRTYVSFVVSKTGDVEDVKVLRSSDPLLDEAAMEIVRSMPKWKPGRQDGKEVRVQYSLPISFKLK
jgi:TonB family protein